MVILCMVMDADARFARMLRENIMREGISRIDRSLDSYKVNICVYSSAEERLSTEQEVEGSNPSRRTLNEELRLMKYVVDINTLIRNSVANPSEC